MPLINRKTEDDRAAEAAQKEQRRSELEARREQTHREARERYEQQQRESQERKEQQRRERGDRKEHREEQKRSEAIAKAQNAFLASPVGRARTAYERGDQVFQYSIDVMNQQAIIVAMIGSTTSKKTSDPTDVLNSVCREGWELVNGSFVFVEQGQQSRDKFLSSGQNVAIKGAVVGYYLFKRSERNRQTPSTPSG